MPFKKVEDIVGYTLHSVGNVYGAYKFRTVLAHRVSSPDGVQLTTYTSDGDVETVNTAACGDWILTHADSITGKPILNEKGDPNSWVVSDEVFKKKYDQTPLPNDVYQPVGTLSRFIQISEDISFVAPWGEIQSVKAGGFLSLDSFEGIYGIAREEFYNAYRVRDVFLLRDEAVFQRDKSEYPDAFPDNV